MTISNVRVFIDPRVASLFEANETSWFLPQAERMQAARAMAEKLVHDFGYEPEDALAAWGRYMAEKRAGAA